MADAVPQLAVVTNDLVFFTVILADEAKRLARLFMVQGFFRALLVLSSTAAINFLDCFEGW